MIAMTMVDNELRLFKVQELRENSIKVHWFSKINGSYHLDMKDEHLQNFALTELTILHWDSN